MDRLIFHIDVNSAFLSWEAVRRVQNGEEDLRLIPSAVGGDKDKRTGIIVAKSIPAKAYGVTTGEPVSMALRKCPNLVLVHSDFALYKKNSHAFMEICRKYAPVVQQYSIDECFLDFTGTSLIYPDPIALAHQIKDEIRDTLGFTVNVGMGPNRLLAKMASDFEKPDKVHTLFLNEIEEKMWPLPVGELLFVGKASTARLQEMGIKTIGDLANSKLEFVQSILGEKGGKQAYEYANGIDESPVSDVREDPKGYSISTTLEEDVVSLDQARGILLRLTDSVAGRMRFAGVKAYCVSVEIRFSKLADVHGNRPSTRFTNRSHQKRLVNATDITDEIYQVVMELFSELWNGEPLRLLGVALTDVTKEDEEQFSLFTDESKERSKKLDAAMDKIRDRFGSMAVYRGNGNIRRSKTERSIDEEE